MSETRESRRQNRVVLVTGPSGAGRTTAIRALEDLGFEAIDNLPMSLMPRLLEGPPLVMPMALGVDVRNREFSSAAVIELIDQVGRSGEKALEVLYIDCSADVLVRRFSETRRRHPLAQAENPLAGIEREIDLLVPIRSRADVLIDTSEFSPHELREEIERWFAPEGNQRLALSIQSFSYKRGLPRGVDMVFDCRFLRNPYWDPALRALNGRSSEVADYVAADPIYQDFFEQVQRMIELLLPAYTKEGKSHLTIAFGCTGGQHRSVTLAENIARALAETGWQVSIRHRELERSTGSVTHS